MTAGDGTHPGSRGSPQQLLARVVLLPHSPGSSGTSASSLTGEGFEPHNYAVQTGQQGQPQQTTSKAHSVEIDQGPRAEPPTCSHAVSSWAFAAAHGPLTCPFQQHKEAKRDIGVQECGSLLPRASLCVGPNSDDKMLILVEGFMLYKLLLHVLPPSGLRITGQVGHTPTVQERKLRLGQPTVPAGWGWTGGLESRTQLAAGRGRGSVSTAGRQRRGPGLAGSASPSLERGD